MATTTDPTNPEYVCEACGGSGRGSEADSSSGEPRCPECSGPLTRKAE